MNRDGCLDTAKSCVCKDRESQYGSPEDNFSTIAEYWTTYLKHIKHGYIEINAKDVAIMMTLLKIGRITGGNFKSDSYVDACGYLACGCEIDTRLTDAYVKTFSEGSSYEKK